MKTVDWVWQNGELKPWSQATVHAMAHGLHYGSTVFEGIRAYKTDRGPAIFRLQEHIDRLFDSCQMYYMPVPFSKETVREACIDVILQNDLDSAYIRPLVYRDVCHLGLTPHDSDAVGVFIGAFEWGPLLGKDSAENGVDVCISSWQRIQSSTNPVMAKAGGHYLTSQLISMEAKRHGYAEGIAVNQNGLVTEGAGCNLFMIKQGNLITPSLGCSILEGITRDSVIDIARQYGIEVVETNIPREALYVADELFLCGTAAELTPVVSVDRIQIGNGTTGELTRQIQRAFQKATAGQDPARENWLTPCVGIAAEPVPVS